MRRALRSATFAAAAVSLLLSACLDRGPEDILGNSAPDPMGRQVWTVILADEAGAVWIVQTDSAIAVRGESPQASSAALWSVLDSAPDLSGLTLSAQVAGRQMHWSLSGAGGALGNGDGAYRPYVGSTGAPRFTGTATIQLGGTPRTIRFDAIGGLPMPLVPVRQLPPVSGRPYHAGRGIVSLRVDDCGAADTASLAALARHRLVAEFAIPTRLVGRATSCSLELLRQIATTGNAIEAHSRYHTGPPPSFADFYLEALGSLRDLRSLGFDPRVFIQPGTWREGPTLFDSPAKLATPYGALLRRAFEAVEAYQQPSFYADLPAGGANWPSPAVITGYSVEQVAAMVRAAAANGQWVEFMWHSGPAIGPQLDARLSVIAAMQDSGLVDVMPFRDALHAVPGPP
jgi:hypothetical protein